ncbi:MAG: hypothetical protein KFF68_02790 [Desulfosarcina sp.]|nr:hypothetical protein [Desulfosarcina sp.]
MDPRRRGDDTPGTFYEPVKVWVHPKPRKRPGRSSFHGFRLPVDNIAKGFEPQTGCLLILGVKVKPEAIAVRSGHQSTAEGPSEESIHGQHPSARVISG